MVSNGTEQRVEGLQREALAGPRHPTSRIRGNPRILLHRQSIATAAVVQPIGPGGLDPSPRFVDPRAGSVGELRCEGRAGRWILPTGMVAMTPNTDTERVAGKREADDYALEAAQQPLVDTFGTTAPGGLVTNPYEDTSLVRGIVAAGPLAIGGVVGNLLNILGTVVIARLLTSREYGSMAQLLGLFFVLSMVGSAFLVGVVRRIAQMVADGHEPLARLWCQRLYRRTLIGVAAWCVIAISLDPWLSRALKLPGDAAALTLMAGSVWLLLCIDRAILQAHRRYRDLGQNLVVEMGVRTVLMLAFAAAGFGVTGFAVALLLGEIVASARAHVIAQRTWGSPAEVDNERQTRTNTRTLSYDLVAGLVGFALISVLQNADVILIGRLHPSSSGSYAAISVASKALVFGAILLGSYVLPETAIRWHRGEHALRQLAVTLIFFAIPTALLLAAALIVPRQLLTIFFGARLSTSAPAFAVLVGAMTCLGVTVMLTHYLFGAARRWIVVLLAAGVVALVVLLHLAGGNVEATARAELEVQGGLAVVVTMVFASTHLRFRTGARVVPSSAAIEAVGLR